jgi:hypothetical protein
MFDKEQPHPSFWETVASAIRGDKLSKRQQLIRMLLLMLVLLILGVDRFIELVGHHR